MGCLSLVWFEHLLIWVVVIVAIVALIRLVLPFALGPLGVAGSTIIQAINIILWAIVAIAVIILIFELLMCLVGFR